MRPSEPCSEIGGENPPVAVTLLCESCTRNDTSDEPKLPVPSPLACQYPVVPRLAVMQAKNTCPRLQYAVLIKPKQKQVKETYHEQTT